MIDQLNENFDYGSITVSEFLTSYFCARLHWSKFSDVAPNELVFDSNLAQMRSDTDGQESIIQNQPRSHVSLLQTFELRSIQLL